MEIGLENSFLSVGKIVLIKNKIMKALLIVVRYYNIIILFKYNIFITRAATIGWNMFQLNFVFLGG